MVRYARNERFFIRKFTVENSSPDAFFLSLTILFLQEVFMIGLLRYAKDYRKQIVLGPFFKFLEAVFELVLPLQMAALVDHGIRQNNWSKVVEMTLWMIAMSVIGMICAVICQYYAATASQGFGTELRNTLMKKINLLSHNELNLFGTDTLITRMTNDINQMQVALAMLIRLVVRAPFLSIGSVIMAFVIDWQAGLIFLCVLPLFCIILFWIISKTVPLYKKVQIRLDELNELVSQNLSGIRVIRAFARTKTETKRFDQATDDLTNVYIRVTNLSALLTPATTMIMNLGIIALFYFGGFKVNIGNLEQGEVLALVNYMNQMLLALIVVSNLVIIFTRAAASASRINEVLDTEPSIDDSLSEVFMDQQKQAGALRFEQVDFSLSPNNGIALKNFDFEFAPGTT